MTRSRLLVVGLAAVVAVCTLSSAALAAAPDAQGWWWQAQQDVPPAEAGTVKVPGTTNAVPPPPGVPPDGLYVASDAQDARGMAALGFNLPQGAEPLTLTLAVADAKGTAIVSACPIHRSWVPEQGGAWRRRPSPNCDAGAVPGALSADAKTLTFNGIGRLAQFGVLSVGLVAGKDPSGVNPTFQLALAKPGPSALTTRQAPVAPTSSEDEPEVDEDASSPPSSATTAMRDSSAFVPAGPASPTAFSPSSFADDAGASPVADERRFADPIFNVPQGARAGRVLAASPGPSTQQYIAGLGLVLVLVAFAYVRVNQRIDALAATGVGASGANQRARGLGVFIKPRFGRPPKV